MARQYIVKQAFFTLDIDSSATKPADKYKIGKTVPCGTYDEATFVDMVGKDFMVNRLEQYSKDGRIDVLDIADATKKAVSKFSVKAKK